jgi:hypothetical protein
MGPIPLTKAAGLVRIEASQKTVDEIKKDIEREQQHIQDSKDKYDRDFEKNLIMQKPFTLENFKKWRGSEYKDSMFDNLVSRGFFNTDGSTKATPRWWKFSGDGVDISAFEKRIEELKLVLSKIHVAHDIK